MKNALLADGPKTRLHRCGCRSVLASQPEARESDPEMDFLEYIYKMTMEVLEKNEGAKQAHDKASLEAARNRLTEARTSTDAREAIREIVANLIGSEEFALYEIDYSNAVMVPRWAVGISSDQQRPVDLLAYREFNRVLKGEGQIFSPPLQLEFFPASIRALTPIAGDEIVSGLLVIFELLPQKKELLANDKRLLQVISLHGGRALAQDSAVAKQPDNAPATNKSPKRTRS